MKVLEIKNNLVKIAYDVTDNIALGGFVILEDSNNPYVAQVMNVKADSFQNFAIVKLLFTFNDEGVLKNYNGTIPSLNANVTELPASELLDVMLADSPIIIGKLAQQNVPVKLDISILENNLLICSDNVESTSNLLENLTNQIGEKVIVWDCDGAYSSDNKINFGIDFKLPLNYETINFIYENDLEDLDVISKAVIQDIFLEVQEYTRTLPEKFIPFSSFLNVVEQQYRETQIPELVLLKNKLLKYKELNVFAENLKDIMNLNIILDTPDYSIIDISNFSSVLQKQIISYVYSVMEDVESIIYSFVKVDNSNSNKKLLKKYFKRDGVYTTIIASHDYKYLKDVKENSQNMIFFAPLTLQHDFASYITYLNKLNSDEFVLYGSHTQNIPLILELSDLQEETLEANVIQDVVEEPNIVSEVKESTTEDLVEDTQKQVVEQDESVIISQQIEDELLQDDINEILTPNFEENNNDELLIPNILDTEEEEISENIGYFEENVEDDIFVEPLNDSLIETEFDIKPSQDEFSHEDLVEQVAKDVDKVFYEKLPAEDVDFDEELVVDELTDDDLNLIDDIVESNDLSEEDEYIDEDSEFEELAPVVPIYEAEHDEITQIFEPGDRVSSPKFGEGIVERMVQYGNKMLCLINFPEIGRRTLDPSMTELTKLS